MASTSWIGTTTDATLDSNWTNGVPDGQTPDGSMDVYVSATPAASIINFGCYRAAQILTTTGNFSNGETVTIDTKTYTFVDPAAPSSDGEVDIGGDADTSLSNLYAAITLGAGSGTAYAAATTAHPSCWASHPSASTDRVWSLDAGTAGNSIATTTTALNASWGDVTLAGGTQNSAATMNNVYFDPDFPGDLNNSGSEAEISCNKFFWRGSGTAYLNFDAVNRMIVDSTNGVLAAQIINTSGIVSLEVVAGRVTLDQNSVSDGSQRVIVNTYSATPATLSVTGSGSIGYVHNVSGNLTLNGPNVTNLRSAMGAYTKVKSGTMTTIWSSGPFDLETTATVTTVEGMGGQFDMTTTAAAKTVTTFWKYKLCDLVYRESFDTITSLKKIGVN